MTAEHEAMIKMETPCDSSVSGQLVRLFLGPCVVPVALPRDVLQRPPPAML